MDSELRVVNVNAAYVKKESIELMNFLKKGKVVDFCQIRLVSKIEI